MRRVLYILLQCTWGLPQTLLGAVIFLLHLRRGHYFYHGVIVSEWGMHDSASIGLFVFIGERDAACRPLLVHEYGHTLQSLLLGPLYLLLIALPSTVWLHLPCFRRMRRKKHLSYYTFYTESWANCWGEKVCGEKSMGRAYIG